MNYVNDVDNDRAERREGAARLFQQALVWDALLPWGSAMNGPDIDSILPRYHSTGVDYVSLTIDAGPVFADTMKEIAAAMRQVRERKEYLCLAKSIGDITLARETKRLALGFNFQETLPYGTNLDNVWLFADLGVRQALLAYNNRNFVGDGCAEPDNAGLSLFGRELVKEMNRAGVLVDGSHCGYRTTMEAMDLCEGPFVFSHSNPFAVRPHYRSIRDDQIKRCAETGGVIGINGVGFWVGDNDAGTDAIFRCLDYTVQLVGPEHVGLGFDFVYDLDNLISWATSNPLMWPPYEGEAMIRHRYAGPEQMVELVELMLEHGYTARAVEQILGENFARVSELVWARG